MLKKLMSSIVIGSIVLSMAGCSSNEQPKEQVYIIKHIDSQGKETKEQVTKEQYDKEVEAAKQEEVKETTKPQVTKKEAAPKEVKKEEPKQQNDNIDTDTGLAKVKDGTHLGEEADKQDKQDEDYGVWNKDYCPECQQPVDKCICNGDGNTTDEWGNTLCPNCGWPKDNCICGKDVEKPETMEYEIHKGTDADGNEYTDYTINDGYVDEDEFNNQMENFGK